MAVILALLALLAGLAKAQNATYHGGAIINVPVTVYLVWYGTPDPTMKTEIEAFVGGIGATPNFQVLTQYAAADGVPVAGSVSFGGSFVQSAPWSFPTGLQFQQILLNAVNAGAVVFPTSATSAGVQLTSSALYVVIGSPGTQFCGGGCLGNHGTYQTIVAGYNTFEAAINGGMSISSTAQAVFHELAEEITEPFSGSGWSLQGGAGGGELADLCQGQPFASVTISGYAFSIQSLWSNIGKQCLFAMPSPLLSLTSPSSQTRGAVRLRGTSGIR